MSRARLLLAAPLLAAAAPEAERAAKRELMVLTVANMALSGNAYCFAASSRADCGAP